MESASEAINNLEVALRGLVRAVLGNECLMSNDKLRDDLEKRLSDEVRRRDGVFVTKDLLAYTHVYELRDLIHKNWEKFKPALRDKKRFDVYMDRVEDFRNVPMHSRSLLPFEESLLIGISGEFRNLITIYRSEQGPDSRFYPTLESVSDSLGTEVDMSTYHYTNSSTRLQVGDTVQFICRAWDPQDRKLTWILDANSNMPLESKAGPSVTLTWRVTEQDVGELAAVRITMSSDGKYHRNGSHDTRCMIGYSVDPPVE